MTSLNTLLETMKTGIADFTYTKTDGSVRPARGTLSNLYIPEDKLPAGTMEYSDNVVRYYDIDSDGWRAFRKDSFCG